jgi:hypothetical protein
MSEAATALPNSAPPGAPAVAGSPASRVTELKVSGHLMTLDTGLFCILQTPSAMPVRDGSGLPGVRISASPGDASGADAVRISTFRDDGWLAGPDAAALVRVTVAQAQILVTIYQSPGQAAEAAPRLQVLRLSADPAQASRPDAAAAAAVPAAPNAGAAPELVAHVARTGDVAVKLGDWVGERGSKNWIEGFGIAPREGIALADIEYQAVLGRGWLSPWIEGGKFCGSRGMALPVLGLRVRLRGAAADAYECRYSATFVDGTASGPVSGGDACETDSLAPLEAFQVELHRKDAAGRQARRMPAPEAVLSAPRTARVLKSAGPSRRPR